MEGPGLIELGCPKHTKAQVVEAVKQFRAPVMLSIYSIPQLRAFVLLPVFIGAAPFAKQMGR
jgi:hypothetical protein